MRTWLALTVLGAGLAAQAPAPGPQFTLVQAIARAKSYNPDFQAALVASGIAKSGVTMARGALLPSLTYNDNYIYTEHNIYVANDGPHEFVSQGDVHDVYSLGLRAELKQAHAAELLAAAQQEIAARGLAATVTSDYYTVLADGAKVATAQQGVTDAQSYLKLTQDREQGGEAAHADVIKAQLTLAQAQSGARAATLAAEQAKITLAVLLFPNFNQDYSLADDLGQAPELPSKDRIEALAAAHNPILAAARAGLDQAKQGVAAAKGALLPTLTLDYFYGIDAHEFAYYNRFHQMNLGNSAEGQLSIPLFHWGADRARVHQSQLQQQQAQQQLDFTRKQMQANLEAFYDEAEAAQADLTTLAQSQTLAAESLRLTALRYSAGDATILELVDAQSANAQARNAYNDGEVRYRVALANLQTLTGTF